MRPISVFLLTLSLTGTPLLAAAQSGVNVYDLNDLSRIQADGSYRPLSFQELNAKNRQVNGLPLPDWQSGVVQFADGTTSSILRLRYDPATDELQASVLPATREDYYKPPTNERLYQPGPVVGFLLSQPPMLDTAPGAAAVQPGTVHFRAVPLDANSFSHAFFEELSPRTTSGAQLLVRYSVELQSGAYNVALNVGSRTATEKLRTTYYLLRPGERPHPIKLSRKAVLAALAARPEAELEAYAKQQHLRLDEPADVARLVSFYNQPAVR